VNNPGWRAGRSSGLPIFVQGPLGARDGFLLASTSGLALTSRATVAASSSATTSELCTGERVGRQEINRNAAGAVRKPPPGAETTSNQIDSALRRPVADFTRKMGNRALVPETADPTDSGISGAVVEAGNLAGEKVSAGTRPILRRGGEGVRRRREISKRES